MVTFADLYDDRFGLAPATQGPTAVSTEALAPLLGRRTCRAYTSEPIAPGLMEALLACAQSAPSKSDLQQYSIVVVEDAGQRQALAALAPSASWIADAPAVLVFCADIARSRRITELRGHGYAANSQDSFVNASVDAGLAMLACLLAAERVGLGGCPISVVRNRIADVSALLALPPGVYPVMGLTLGHPAETPPASMRLPPAIVVHRDRYDSTNLADELAGYDDRRHARQPVPPEKQRHTDRYGVREVCPWSENVARQLSLPERADFREFLLVAGFDLA